MEIPYRKLVDSCNAESEFQIVAPWDLNLPNRRGALVTQSCGRFASNVALQTLHFFK